METIYFAYGSNMDQAQMKRRCPQAKLIGLGKLNEFQFIINERGVASVISFPKKVVYGLLWRISQSDEDYLDDYEGVSNGHYRKIGVNIEQPDFTRVQAMIYVATNKSSGSPRPNYMEKIITAAENHKMPAEYIKELTTWITK